MLRTTRQHREWLAIGGLSVAVAAALALAEESMWLLVWMHASLVFVAVYFARFLHDKADRMTRDADARWALQGAMQQGIPWPEMGGWALGPRALTSLVRELRTSGARNLVELGPGVSTIILGKVFPEIAQIGVEHDKHYSDALKNLVEQHAVVDVQVVHAPLASYPSGPDWYSPNFEDELPHKVDALIVDGPPNWDGRGRRSRAEQLIAERMRPGSVVLVDDAHRRDERRMVESWVAKDLCGVVLDDGDFVLLRVR